MIELARLAPRAAHDGAGFDPRRDRRRQGACRRGGASLSGRRGAFIPINCGGFSPEPSARNSSMAACPRRRP